MIKVPNIMLNVLTITILAPSIMIEAPNIMVNAPNIITEALNVITLNHFRQLWLSIIVKIFSNLCAMPYNKVYEVLYFCFLSQTQFGELFYLGFTIVPSMANKVVLRTFLKVIYNLNTSSQQALILANMCARGVQTKSRQKVSPSLIRLVI